MISGNTEQNRRGEGEEGEDRRWRRGKKERGEEKLIFVI